MVETERLSEAKRALLEKYLQGDVPNTAPAAGTITQRVQESTAPWTLPGSRVPLVPVQTGGSKRPLFYVHPHWEGGAFYAFALARDLGPDQPFYVLDPYRFDGLQAAPTLDTMASAYVESIRTVQPTGPYRLAAFCGPCLIALEIAQQLRAAGQAVEVLVLIEPGLATYWPQNRMKPMLESYGPTFLRLVTRFIRGIGGVIRLSPDEQLNWFLRLHYAYRVLRYAGRRNSPRIPLAPTIEALRQDWEGIFVWVVATSVPRRYAGKATYLWARDEPGHRRAAWDKVVTTDEAEVYIIPGTHTTCRNDDLPALADHLGTCLVGSATVNADGDTRGSSH